MLFTPDISDMELQERWRLYWLHTIFEFSNSNLQRTYWDESNNTQQSDEVSNSYAQSYSAYFDDLALDDAYEKAIASSNVTVEEAKRAKKFHHLLLFYDEPFEVEGTINEMLLDSEWLEVIQEAKLLWDYLKVHISSKREQKLITALEQKFSQ